MDAIVHIGLPKTGSTAIQTYLANNAAALRDHGIHYDTSAWIGKSNHIEAVLAALSYGGLELNAKSAARSGWMGTPAELKLLGERALDGITRLGKAAPAQTVVFSSEFFSVWLRTREELTALHEMMTTHFASVRYIAYFRDPVGHTESDYNQLVKSGLTDNFTTFARAYPKKISDWADRVMILGDLAGPDAIDIRSFDREALVGGNVITDFCNAIGVDKLPSTEFPASNPSLNLSGIRLLRAVNRALPSDMVYDAAHAMRDGLIPSISKVSQGGAKLVMDDVLATEVYAASAPIFDALGKAFPKYNPPAFPTRSRAPDATSDAMDAKDSAELEMMAQLVLEITVAAERQATLGAVAKQKTNDALAPANSLRKRFSHLLRNRFQS